MPDPRRPAVRHPSLWRIFIAVLSLALLAILTAALSIVRGNQ